MPPTRRPHKEPVTKRQPGIATLDAVLMRCATIERRLDAIEARMDNQTQRVSAMQAQIDQLADKSRS
jgi:hypothetical protein